MWVPGIVWYERCAGAAVPHALSARFGRCVVLGFTDLSPSMSLTHINPTQQIVFASDSDCPM